MEENLMRMERRQEPDYACNKKFTRARTHAHAHTRTHTYSH